MKLKYDYYTVKIPLDLGNDIRVINEAAICEAEERAHIWATPATWTAKLLRVTGSNYVVRVTRARGFNNNRTALSYQPA